MRGGEERAGGVEVDADRRVGLQGQVGEEKGRVERGRGCEEREGGGGDEDDEEARGGRAGAGGDDEDGGGLRWRRGEVVEVVGGEAGRRRVRNTIESNEFRERKQLQTRTQERLVGIGS